MIKKLLLITFILLNVRVSEAVSNSISFIANTPPTISNFRVEDASTSRVYFDSSEPITASNATGFTISLKTISGITINSGQLTGHYFTVSSPFTFWDNNTIRYEGGSDLMGVDSSSILYDMTLSYIVNNIPEPDALDYRYVTATAGGGGDGLTEATAWTLEEAMGYATFRSEGSYNHFTGLAHAGQTVWVKAGNYGAKLLSIQQDGTPTSPIKFIGYKTTPGDITSNYWDYTTTTQGDYASTWNTSEMPTLTGTDAFGFEAIQLRGTNYLIIRNFQITNYEFGIRANGSRNTNVVLDRINGHTFGGGGDSGGSFMFMQTFQVAGSYPKPFASNTNYKIRDCRSVNADLHAIGIFGEGVNLFDGNKTYNNWTAHDAVQDYHQTLSGHNSIIRNCYAENFNTVTYATSHGIGIKGATNLSNTYNLIEKCTAINVVEGLFLRNFGCEYNVIKDSYVGNNENAVNYLTRDMTGGVYIWGGANYNTIERITVEECYYGIFFRDVQGEDYLPDTSIGHDNVIRNCTFNKTKYSVFSSGSTNSLLKDNKIINCTFNNSKEVFYQYRTNVQNLQFINCIIKDHTENYVLSQPAGISFTNCDFYGNTGNWNVAGNGNMNVDPEFISETNLHLQPTSPIKDAGIDDINVDYDKDGVKRISGKYSIGAYDDAIPSVGSVTPDTSICVGESATLVATGGTSYSWNTGETTETITVSPTTTTTYSVTISDGSNSDTHDVIVTVSEPPSVDAGLDVSICSDEDVTLTATGVGDFLWSTGETTASITVTPSTTTTYTVTASNSCSTDATDEVIVNVTPGVTLDAGPDITMCTGESITLTATGNANFQWNTGETTASITVNPSTTITYTVTSTNGNCSKTDDVIVTVNEAPSVDVGSDVSICSDEDVTLTATGVGDFLWSTGETTASITVNPTTTTSYTVTASNSCSTDVTDEVIVNVTPGVTLDAGPDITICTGESITLTATGNANFQWNTGETTASITVNPSATTTTYTVTSTNGNCSKTDDVIVTVNETSSVDAGSDVSICSGEYITLAATGVGNFLWSTGETTSSITVNPSATITYTVTASTSCGTDATDDVIVTVTPEVTLNAGSDVTMCSGENVTLTAVGNGDFLWNTGETTASINVSPTNTTTYTVTSNLGSCSKTEDVVVTVNQAPTVNAGSDVTMCSGENITLTATGQGNFLWSTGEISTSITVSPSTTTTYSVTSSNSCTTSTTDEVIVTVNPGVTLDAGSDVSICSGETITLTAQGNGDFLWNTGETTASINVSPTSTTTYTVTSSLGNCSKTDDVIVTVGQLPAVNAGSDVSICSGESITLTATGQGNFLWNTGETTASITVNPSATITYTVTASSSCSADATDDITVTVNDKPTVSASDDITIENGSSTTLTATGQGNFLWSTGETTSSITVSPETTTTYTVTITSDEGCSNEDSVVVTVEEVTSQVVDADAGEDVEICENAPSVVLVASGGDNYLWSTGEITASITVNPTETTIYTVTVSNNSSIDSDQVTIFVDSSCSGTGNRVSSTKEMNLYPNPTEGELNIEISGYSDALNISLYSLNGSMVYSEDINNPSPEKPLKRQIDLSRFGTGVYFVRLTNNNTSETKKIIVI